MTYSFDGFGGLPGIDAIRETVEEELTWGPWEWNRSCIIPALIQGEARDSAHTGNTTILRPGLVMAAPKIGQTGVWEWKEWASGATDGTEVIGGILYQALHVQQSGANADKYIGYIIGGHAKIKASKIIPPGNASPGIEGDADEAAIRSGLAAIHVLLDDYYVQG